MFNCRSLITGCLLMLAAGIHNAHARQEQPLLSTLSLAVIVPENAEGMSSSQLSKLESRITTLVAESGLAASSFNQPFIIYPKFEIYNIAESKSGMQKITVADCQLNLFIKQVSTGTIFSAYNKRIQGSGFNSEEAIVNALSKIDPADESMVAFVTRAREKIIAYYNQNCELVMQKAEKERLQKKYESALVILLSIPEEATGCYKKVQSKALAVFKELEQHHCAVFLQQAKALAAGNDYEGALTRISWIDPSANCGTEAKILLNNIGKEVDDDKKKAWDLVFKVYEGKLAVQKAQYQAMNNIATTWLLSQPRTTSYNILVK